MNNSSNSRDKNIKVLLKIFMTFSQFFQIGVLKKMSIANTESIFECDIQIL